MIENIKGEVWKQYGDTPYYFSNCGRVKRKYKTHEKLLKPYERRRLHRKGYYSKQIVKIHRKEVLVNRTVWELFNGAIPAGYYVHHKDNCWFNNDLLNLELLTPAETGLKTGRRSRRAKAVFCLDNYKTYRSVREAAKALYVSGTEISAICNGKRKNPCVNVRWKEG